MANSYDCIVEADNAEVSSFYNALLLAGGDPRQLRSPVSDERLRDFSLTPPSQRLVGVAFQCYCPPPVELVRSVSKLFPTLVFAIRYLPRIYRHVGFALYRDGTCLRSAINHDVYRAEGRDPEACEAEALHPEAATIDGYEATLWASRLSDALNAVSREAAIEAGLGDDQLDLERFADRVEELGPEYEHATTPLDRERRFLEELCEQATLLEARVACRLAVREALGNPVNVGGSGQVVQPGQIDPPTPHE